MVRNNRNLRLPVSVPLLLVTPLALVVLLGGCGQSLPSGSLPTSSPVIKGTFTEYSLPMSGSSATSIVTGPDSNIWFTEVAATNNGPITDTPPHRMRGVLGSSTGLAEEYLYSAVEVPCPQAFHETRSWVSLCPRVPSKALCKMLRAAL